LSRFASKVKRGTLVSQGQVIGYVGETGLATGPHLHYELRVHGVHRNPLTVSLPNADPIAKRYRSAFVAETRPLLARLDDMNRTMLAAAQ
jgi:murein DD-endopeptidase MepM/ murein hydrolase activator NlpD